MSSSREMKSVLINCEWQRWKYDLIQAKQISSIATPFIQSNSAEEMKLVCGVDGCVVGRWMEVATSGAKMRSGKWKEREMRNVTQNCHVEDT